MNKNLPIILPIRVMYFTLTLVGFLSFAVPFSLGHPQMVVGSIVNAGLILSALFLPQSFINSLIFFPSLAVLSRGLIFGPLTLFLAFMIPFIWSSNWLLVYFFKKIFNKSQNYWLSLFFSAMIKSLFLFVSAYLLFRLKLVPKLFLTTFSYLQYLTAIFGGTLAYIVKNLYDRFPRT